MWVDMVVVSWCPTNIVWEMVDKNNKMTSMGVYLNHHKTTSKEFIIHVHMYMLLCLRCIVIKRVECQIFGFVEVFTMICIRNFLKRILKEKARITLHQCRKISKIMIL